MEELKKKHDEDLAIAERYGVFELKYWVNGNAACNIIEVSEDEFNLYFGIGKSVNDLAHTESGEIDTGFRTILPLSHYDLSDQNVHYLKDLYSINLKGINWKIIRCKTVN